MTSLISPVFIPNSYMRVGANGTDRGNTKPVSERDRETETECETAKCGRRENTSKILPQNELIENATDME